MKSLRRASRYALFDLNGLVGRHVRLDGLPRATVLLTYFHPVRMEHIDAQLRNILKCDFVDRLVVSNHNPAVTIQQKVSVKDDRLVFINQPEARVCGYRWLVAADLDAEYLLVVDDDMLLFPAQIARLFAELVENPGSPHGLSGMLRDAGGQIEYHEKVEMAVDYLTEVYAVTGKHVQRYLELRSLLAKDAQWEAMVDALGDFLVISRSGSEKPRIHYAGRILRSPTYKQAGVAMHKHHEFDDSLIKVSAALDAIVEDVNEATVD